MTREQQFYDTLQNIFIGAPVEGQSGYINLMRIKARYLQQVLLPRLAQEVDAALQPFPEFREELFDKLYTFFRRYFTESGSLGLFFTPYHQSVYERVYTDDRDVMLFWKTARLYYVKSDRLFRSMTIALDGFRFSFDVSTLEHKRANEKRELLYTFRERREDGTLVFTVTYAERGRTAHPAAIRRSIQDALRPRVAGRARPTDTVPSEETLARAFRLFERQSEVDYFICKDARTFLREQLDLWLYQYLLGRPGEEPQTEWTERRIGQIQALRRVAYRTIDLIADFEDELVRLWNKPKFVLHSHYVITLDRIAARPGGAALLERLWAHPGMVAQQEEWRQLGLTDIAVAREAALSSRHRYLPIDTRYFPDLEPEILALFDPLDRALDGWLIRSENYQALRTLLPKFRGRVRTIYVDPPFNKEQEADYFYSVKYRNSTWATLLENRLALAREFLSEEGCIFVRCDASGNWIVRGLMDSIFGPENFVNEISVRRFRKNVMEKEVRKLPEGLDTLYVYARSDRFAYVNPFRPKAERRAGFWRHMGDSSGPGRPKRFFGKELAPPAGKHWKFSQERIDEMIRQGRLVLECRECGAVHDRSQGLWAGCPRCGADHPIPKYWVEAREEEVLDSNWSDIYGYATAWAFPTENSEALLKRVLLATSAEGDLVMDFFLGSGTLTAVAHKLGRKWIGVEMGEHFYTVVLPRMKRVLAYDRSGISRDPDVRAHYNPDRAGGFFKYYELEQYEDTLRRVRYGDADEDDWPYIFGRDLKMLDALEIEGERVRVNLSRLYDGIDLAETLSHGRGRWIRRITPEEVEFEDGERVSLREPDYRLLKPFLWWI
ncbi:MAG: site-specific DNA-methyltransferase [Anaerolineae bacterium]|nr:site-specific DNA-methyltransferase [Anaerolineae bacterium]MDW8067479.1 site-specific DNA-methyltransferase [Anaerolineae bacterium]